MDFRQFLAITADLELKADNAAARARLAQMQNPPNFRGADYWTAVEDRARKALGTRYDTMQAKGICPC